MINVVLAMVMCGYVEVGRFSLKTAFIIQEKEFIVAKTYHAD